MGLRRRNRKLKSEQLKKKSPLINPIVTGVVKLASFLVPKLAKGGKGKWDSKRTIGGVIAVAAVYQMEVEGVVSWKHILMLVISVATLYAPDRSKP